jgi:hypothetical protein
MESEVDEEITFSTEPYQDYSGLMAQGSIL